MISATPLTSGKLWSKAARLSRGSEFNVEASGAVAGVRGTEFGFSVIPTGTSLTVLSGKVALSPTGGGAPFFFADSDTMDPAENGDVVTGLFVDVAAGGPAGAGVGTATARELTPAEKALIRQRYYGSSGTAQAEGPRITDMSVPEYVLIPKNLADSSELGFHVRPRLEGYDPDFGPIPYTITSDPNGTAECWGSGEAAAGKSPLKLELPFTARLPAGAASGECLLRLTLTLPVLPNPMTLTEEKTVTVKRYDQDWDPVRQMTVPSAEDASRPESSLETGYGAYLSDAKVSSGVSETVVHVNWTLELSDHALLDMTLTDTDDPPHVFHVIQDLTGAEEVAGFRKSFAFTRDIPKSNFSLTEENHLKLELRYIRLKDILQWKRIIKPEEFIKDAAAVEAVRLEAIDAVRNGTAGAPPVSETETSFSFRVSVPTVLRMGFTDSAGNPVTAPLTLESGTTLPLRLSVLDSNEETLPADLQNLNRYCAWSVGTASGGAAPGGVSVTNDGVVIAGDSVPAGPLTVTCTFPPPAERTLLDLGGREYKIPDQLLWEKQTVEVTLPQISVTGLQILAGPNPVPDNHNVLLNATQRIRYGLSLATNDPANPSRSPDATELIGISCTQTPAGETTGTAVTFNSASSIPVGDPFTFDIPADTPTEITIRCEMSAFEREFTVFVHRPTTPVDADSDPNTPPVSQFIYSIAGRVGSWGEPGPDGTFGTADDVQIAVTFCSGLTEGGVPAGTWTLPSKTLLEGDKANWCSLEGTTCRNMPSNPAGVTGQNKHWTNESDPTDATKAWFVPGSALPTNKIAKTTAYGYRCIRPAP